ncbi:MULTISPECIES: hypothetical protein [unclassified Neorhizobium]|nr:MULTISPECIES: hypothetical protein [unclassified Neorhizobium]MCJ9670335.1 hypothetical protein [Neorhizobium sp. SHOUNA12B]MCJ9746590.1 hypothetical protein [Neorhizobium sp. SHOUNA12A]
MHRTRQQSGFRTNGIRTMHHEDEERMLTDMPREDLEPDDYLDWWKK